MAHGRLNPHHKLLRFADVEDAILAIREGTRLSWRCYGSCSFKAAEMDLWEIYERCGPRWCLQNEIGVCPCGSPRTLMYSNGAGTPFRPLKDEWLWVSKELTYCSDPHAWFEIQFMEDNPVTFSRPHRRADR